MCCYTYVSCDTDTVKSDGDMSTVAVKGKGLILVNSNEEHRAKVENGQAEELALVKL